MAGRTEARASPPARPAESAVAGLTTLSARRPAHATSSSVSCESTISRYVWHFFVSSA